MTDPLHDPAAAILRQIRERPGVTIGQLIDDGADPDVLYTMIARRACWVDLDRHVLADGDHVPLFPNAEIAAAYAHLDVPTWALGGPRPLRRSLRPGEGLEWDGRSWEVVNPGMTTTYLRSIPDGDLVPMPTPEVLKHLAAGTMTVARDEEAAALESGRRMALSVYAKASEKDWAKALVWYRIVTEWRATGAPPENVSLSAIRRRATRQEQWQRLTGDPFVGYFDEPRPGNRNPKVDLRLKVLAATVFDEVYFQPQRPLWSNVVGEFWRRCREHDLWPPGQKRPPVSERTLRDWRDSYRTMRDERKRLGRTLVGNKEPWAPIDPDAGSVHGDFAFHRGHMDATLIDLRIVFGEKPVPDGEVDEEEIPDSARMWLIRYVDTYTEVELAHLFTFHEPNAGHVLLLWRYCVEEWGRITQTTILDLAGAHRGHDVVSFAAANACEVEWRRAKRPRTGSVIERSFGRLNTEVWYRIAGNTQVTRVPRGVTKETDPLRLARTRREQLEAVHAAYLEVFEHSPRARDGRVPREVLASSLAQQGSRPASYIANDGKLRLLTMPLASNRKLKVQQNVGIRIGPFDYWHPLFDHPALAGVRVVARRDRGDVASAAAYVELPIDAAVVQDAAERAEREGFDELCGVPTVDTRIQRLWIPLRARALAHLRVVSYEELAALSSTLIELKEARRRGRAAYQAAVADAILRGLSTPEADMARLMADPPRLRIAEPPPVVPPSSPLFLGFSADEPSIWEQEGDETVTDS